MRPISYTLSRHTARAVAHLTDYGRAHSLAGRDDRVSIGNDSLSLSCPITAIGLDEASELDLMLKLYGGAQSSLGGSRINLNNCGRLNTAVDRQEDDIPGMNWSTYAAYKSLAKRTENNVVEEYTVPFSAKIILKKLATSGNYLRLAKDTYTPASLLYQGVCATHHLSKNVGEVADMQFSIRVRAKDRPYLHISLVGVEGDVSCLVGASRQDDSQVERSFYEMVEILELSSNITQMISLEHFKLSIGAVDIGMSDAAVEKMMGIVADNGMPPISKIREKVFDYVLYLRGKEELYSYFQLEEGKDVIPKSLLLTKMYGVEVRTFRIVPVEDTGEFLSYMVRNTENTDSYLALGE